MIELVGKQVKIFLTTRDTVCEGIITSYADDTLVLSNPDNKNLLLINNPKQNILMVHVILEKHSEHDLKKVRHQVMDPNPEDLELEKFEPDPTLRGQKLAELRKLQLQEHKQRLRKHLTTWRPQGIKTHTTPDYYEHPSFTDSPRDSSSQESNGSTSSNPGRMFGLHKKPGKTG